MPHIVVLFNRQKELISNIKKNISSDEFVQSVNNLAIDILNHYPSSRRLFSGNIDAKEIRNTARKYGFSDITNHLITKNGEKLATTKSKRNDLAHGFISFQECGKDYTIQDIISIKEETLKYLEGILKNIETFLTNEDYKIA